MNSSIRTALKERKRLNKYYSKNGFLPKAEECAELILAAKNEQIIRISNKLNYHKTVAKINQTVLNKFLYNKEIPVIPRILVGNTIV